MVLNEVLVYSLISVILVSLISLIGVITLSINVKKLKKILIYLISFSAGALFGDAFLHLLPETVNAVGFGLNISLYFLLGIIIFFVLEKFIHWQHCHGPITEEEHTHAFAYTNLIGDGLHNFIDGLIIGASYLISLPVGIATTLAVALHEIPQEIGDYGILLHAGFSRGKALLVNFATALFSVFGVIVALGLSGSVDSIELILAPLAAGGFVYIAGSDLIPEMHKHSEKMGRSLLQLISFIVGILVMFLLLFIG
jgi:zinc and cadmium transporter